ncbi:hypothetical protein OO012_18070 [Rhodobacteraceae bacterium KMM 6894]|nr:hypothetical protein [Rhodobacteraceae bacterium KMM 6894]
MRGTVIAIVLTLWAGPALAHASNQGFVLLLPTDIYIAAGVACVVMTVLLLVILPEGVVNWLSRPIVLSLRRARVRHWVSALCALLLIGIILIGYSGPRDPMKNPLPLTIWVVWWIGLVTVQGIVGDLWKWINPWTGPAQFLGAVTGRGPLLRYPRALGYAPAIVGLVGFAGFLMADPAPSDPPRLAMIVGGYWLAMLGGVVLFGPRWLLRAEAVTVLMRSYARMSILGRVGGHIAIGFPGWQVLKCGGARRTGLAVFMLLLLGSGSFDGLNETFWWFGQLGLNPLEFAGRSTVVSQNWVGLVAANLALIAVFFVSTWVGLRLAHSDISLGRAVRAFAPAVLPIALGYHIAHYLTSFLVEGQYVLELLSDPFQLGADLLKRGAYSITTGFLHTPGPVRIIWLTQAGAVVIGHVIAIILAHALAMRLFQSRRAAVLSQAPLALFMIGYTFFGLWLLASPRGV